MSSPGYPSNNPPFNPSGNTGSGTPGADPMGLAVSATQTGVNNMMSFMNRRYNRRQEAKLWKRNRQAAIDDWNMVNAYNHPKQQMARLAEAGLNPNLIYGDATAATGIADGPSKYSNAPGPESNIHMNEIDLYGLEQQRLMNQNIENQGNLINAQILKTLTDVDKKQLDTQLLMDTYDELVKAAGLSNEETGADITYKGQQVQESWQRIRKMEVEIGKIVADTDFTLDQNQRNQIASELNNAKTIQETKLIAQKLITEMRKSLMDYQKMGLTEKEYQYKMKQIEMLEYQIDQAPREEARDWINTIIHGSKTKTGR